MSVERVFSIRPLPCAERVTVQDVEVRVVLGLDQAAQDPLMRGAQVPQRFHPLHPRLLQHLDTLTTGPGGRNFPTSHVRGWR